MRVVVEPILEDVAGVGRQLPFLADPEELGLEVPDVPAVFLLKHLLDLGIGRGGVDHNAFVDVQRVHDVGNVQRLQVLTTLLRAARLHGPKCKPKSIVILLIGSSCTQKTKIGGFASLGSKTKATLKLSDPVQGREHDSQTV